MICLSALNIFRSAGIKFNRIRGQPQQTNARIAAVPLQEHNVTMRQLQYDPAYSCVHHNFDPPPDYSTISSNQAHRPVFDSNANGKTTTYDHLTATIPTPFILQQS